MVCKQSRLTYIGCKSDRTELWPAKGVHLYAVLATNLLFRRAKRLPPPIGPCGPKPGTRYIQYTTTRAIIQASWQLPASSFQRAYRPNQTSYTTHASHHPIKTITYMQTYRLLVEKTPSLKDYTPLAEVSYSILHYNTLQYQCRKR